ncbi:acyloxyacyl hydrolase [Pseudoduganella flava]|nr:acyloxyacyl hydrolase [Pseudoduganella flava]
MLAAVAALMAANAAFAADGQMIDGVYGEFATGSKVRMVRLGATKDWNPNWSWFDSGSTHLTGYWDASIGGWELRQTRNVPGDKSHIVDIGFTPVLRWENKNKLGLYGEIGIGAHVLSHHYDNNDDGLSTAFQFGDHIGVGYVFNKNWEVALKMQHFSNGGIKKPNSGVDYGVIKLAYRF